MPRPATDGVSGIAPAVAIEQKNPTTSSRSTVGTATEIYDYLRLLWARIGRVHCVTCGGDVRADTVQQVVDALVSAIGWAADFFLMSRTPKYTAEKSSAQRGVRSALTCMAAGKPAAFVSTTVLAGAPCPNPVNATREYAVSFATLSGTPRRTARARPLSAQASRR